MNKLYKTIFITSLLLIVTTSLKSQVYTYDYTSGGTYQVTATFTTLSWGETQLEMGLKNTGSVAINMSNAKVVYSAQQSAWVNYTNLGGLSYPDRLGHEVIADDPVNTIVDTLVLPAASWAQTDLAPGNTFAYKVSLGSTTLSGADQVNIAQSIRLYAQGWTMPQFKVPVTFNFTGNGGNNVTVSVRNTQTAAVIQQTIATGTVLSLKNNSSFQVWANNFTAGGSAYTPDYTASAPLAISTPSNTSVTITFTSTPIPTATLVLNVSGLPAGATTEATISSAPGATWPYSSIHTITNGTNNVPTVPLGTYNISISKYTNNATNQVAVPSYNSSYTLTNSSGPVVVTYTTQTIQPMGVPGWPNYLAHGTVTQPGPAQDAGLQAAPVDAIFKYSGDDGAGDRGLLYANNPFLLNATKGTIAQARRLEKYDQTAYNLPGFTVMPVMIHYTANGSGGGTVGAAPDYLDSANLRIHYRNLIREVKTMLDSQNATHPFPGTFILSPDLLGALQQDFSSQQTMQPYDYNNPTVFTVNVFRSKVFVNQKLKEAFQQEGFSVPANIPVFLDSLKGYFQSLNYLIHTIGQNKILFGWQENLWSIGSANWIHTPTTAASAAQQVVTFLRDQVGVFEGPYKPDFLAIDRYERDCFSPGTSGSYAYNAAKWKKTVDYGGAIAKAFNLPLMLWQFPGGHLVHKDSTVNQYDLANHSSACGSYFLGEPSIGTNLNNINATQLNIAIPPGNYNGASTVGALLAQDNGYDWGQSQLENVANNNNVFAILWGGGSTTSISNIGTNGYDDGWLAGKLRKYYQNGLVYKTSQTLPLVWLSFSAEGQGDHARLEWRTAAEIDVDHFEVEYTLDGSQFKKLTSVVAGNDPNGHYIQLHTGAAQLGKVLWYRIREVDLNGKDSYSPVKRVSFQSPTGTNFLVYPNPVNAGTPLHVKDKNIRRIAVIDAIGSFILSRNYTDEAEVLLPTQALKPGVYWIKVNGKDAGRVVVQ
jgi:hypothetical protein